MMNALRIRYFSFSNHWANLSIRIGYVLLHQTDLMLTVFGTSRGLFELNPIIRSVLDLPEELILVKVAIPLIIAILTPTKLMTPALALLVIVNVWDMGQLFARWL